MTPRTIAAAAMLAMMAVPVPVGTSSSTPLFISAETAPHGFTKMIIVVLENTNYADALQQSFLASLAKRGALLTNFTAEAHPSQPNYIALISGSTHDVTSDRNVTLDARHVGDLLEAKSLQWKVYAEGYPGNCFLGTQSGTYVRKHVPFLSFKDVQTDPTRCARIVDATELATDIRNGKLPDYSLYIPDLKNDGHDTGVAYADRWLSAKFGPLLADTSFTDGLMFVVTFDEGKSLLFGSNHVATILIGDGVPPGSILDGHYNHYSLLRLVEDRFALGTLGQNDVHANVIIIPGT
jgi:Phosphoesterase family